MDKDQTTAQVKSQTDDQVQAISSQEQATAGLGAKEKEAVGTSAKEIVEEVSKEIAPPKEIEKYVEIKKEKVEIPAEVEKLGLRQTGPATPVLSTPSVTLPLSDDQIIKGLHAQIASAIRWLAEFCLRKLKKTHIHLKKIHGKIVRVKD